jgi:cell division protein FtsW (lipid II flippase)
VVAVWCFLEEKFVWAGILCLSVSLAIKPHDAGTVWLYFLLAGGIYRKRALQTLVVTTCLGLATLVWITPIAPHWMQELHSNILVNQLPGEVNDPGPVTAHASGPSMVISLQSTLSVFRDDPRFYNLASYLICGSLLLVWTVRTIRSRFSPANAWFALAAVVPLTLLVTYHRPYDAKLLLLAVPACAMLWVEGGPLRWFALLVTAMGIGHPVDNSYHSYRRLAHPHSGPIRTDGEICSDAAHSAYSAGDGDLLSVGVCAIRFRPGRHARACSVGPDAACANCRLIGCAPEGCAVA